jgi:hypothetical protein
MFNNELNDLLTMFAMITIVKNIHSVFGAGLYLLSYNSSYRYMISL